MSVASIMIIAVIILSAFLCIGMIFSRLYTRSSKETSFVRTGFGGQRVIMNGGCLVLPVLHEVIPVNMNTLRLEVRRAEAQALITRDRMRVDVTAEFYVRVKPSEESIANSAQTLGMKTMNPSELKELVEGKFVDALRSVAAEMTMTELHEKRVDFVQKVQQVVSEDLLKNGLELETVSLTGLDQTVKDFFNPDNAFDAEGLTKLTEEIQVRRMKRNIIEQDTEVSIANKNLDAEKLKLEIQKEEEYAKLQQEREIEIRKAAQIAEIAKERAEKQQAAEQAQIESKQRVDMSRIEAERAVEEGGIEKDRQVREKEITKEKILETAKVEQQKAVELAEQDRAIAIAEKSREKSESQAEADKARAMAVKEEEGVITVRESEVAEREKIVELIEADKAAQKEAIKIKVAAETQKIASEDEAESIRIVATAEADKLMIEAKAHADSQVLKADAEERRYVVEADGKRALNEADNTLSEAQVAMQIKMALIKYLPEIIRESVKPMENIDGIKIIQVDGLNGSGASVNGTNGDHASASSLSDQLVNSALRYRGQAPLVDSLLADIGLKGGDINGMTSELLAQSVEES